MFTERNKSDRVSKQSRKAEDFQTLHRAPKPESLEIFERNAASSEIFGKNQAKTHVASERESQILVSQVLPES
jgi:hypothetical protein